MAAQQDAESPYHDATHSNMMLKSIDVGNTLAKSHLEAQIIAMEEEITILRNSMDAMALDLATSEALTKEIHEAKERLEVECSALTQQVHDLSTKLQEQSGIQANELHENMPITGVQPEEAADVTREDIGVYLRSQFQQREAELVQRCKIVEATADEHREQCEDMKMRLRDAETQIAALQKQNNQQLVELNEMAAKEEISGIQLESNSASEAATKIEQLQLLVKYYKANSERASRDVKELKQQAQMHNTAPIMPPPTPFISATGEHQHDTEEVDDEKKTSQQEDS